MNDGYPRMHEFKFDVCFLMFWRMKVRLRLIYGIINIRRKTMEWFIVNNAKGLQTVLSQLEVFDQKFFEIPHWTLRKQKRL